MESERRQRNPAVNGETLDPRTVSVRRRFKQGRRDAMGRSFWENWRPENGALLVAMHSTVLLIFLEPALFGSGPAGMLAVRIPNSIAAALLLILPFNGWLLDRFLSSKTPGEISFPWRLMVLRRVLAGLPLANLYALSLWRAILDPEPAERARRSASLDLSRGEVRLPGSARSRVFYRSGFFFVWLAGSLLPLLAWAVWLAQTQALGPWHRPVILGVCILIHLTCSLSMVLYLRPELQNPLTRGGRKLVISITPLLWLLGLPGLVLGFAAFLWTDRSHKSLTWTAYASRSGANRDPLWRGLQTGLQQQWQKKPWFAQWSRPTGLSRAEGVGKTEVQILSLYRLKTLLLVLDGAALFEMIPGAARPGALSGILWATAVLAGVGLAVELAGLLARLLRVPWAETLRRHPYGRSLLLTQAAFLAGAFEASLWSTGQIQWLGMFLCLGSALCGMLSGLFLFFPTAVSPHGPDMALWGVLFLSIAAWGGLIALDGEAGQPSLVLLRILILLTPLWSFGLFLALGGWLLRPFSWRDVFDDRLPWRLRGLLAFVAVTAALPLGGLAIPVWIHARRRVLLKPFVSGSYPPNRKIFA